MNAGVGDEDVLVCRCCGVHQSAVERAVARGARSMERVMDLTGASGVCGTCVNDIRRAFDHARRVYEAEQSQQEFLPF